MGQGVFGGASLAQGSGWAFLLTSTLCLNVHNTHQANYNDPSTRARKPRPRCKRVWQCPPMVTSGSSTRNQISHGQRRQHCIFIHFILPHVQTRVVQANGEVSVDLWSSIFLGVTNGFRNGISSLLLSSHSTDQQSTSSPKPTSNLSPRLCPFLIWFCFHHYLAKSLWIVAHRTPFLSPSLERTIHHHIVRSEVCALEG